jgi:hypothetical protein
MKDLLEEIAQLETGILYAKAFDVIEEKEMKLPAASYGVSKTARNEASFGGIHPERLKS